MINQFDRVRLITDRFVVQGAMRGAQGYVLEIYEDGALEIEVSGADGGTVAIFVAQPYEVEPDPE